MHGTGNKRTVEIYKEEFTFKESVDELVIEREKRFFKLLDQRIPPMEGAFEFVESLAKQKIKIAIATSGPHKYRMKKILRELRISRYISAIVTGEEIQNLKPAPDIFLIAAKKLNRSRIQTCCNSWQIKYSRQTPCCNISSKKTWL